MYGYHTSLDHPTIYFSLCTLLSILECTHKLLALSDTPTLAAATQSMCGFQHLPYGHTCIMNQKSTRLTILWQLEAFYSSSITHNILTPDIPRLTRLKKKERQNYTNIMIQIFQTHFIMSSLSIMFMTPQSKRNTQNYDALFSVQLLNQLNCLWNPLLSWL